MAEEKHHHHLFHHHKDEKQPVDTSVYSETTFYAAGNEVDYKKEEKHHKNLEHLGEMGAVAAGAFALHEKHKARKDPEHAHRHKIEEEIAAAAAVGAGGFPSMSIMRRKKQRKNMRRLMERSIIIS
ncbi:Abscisic stress-ripening protein 1 [Spatholobus suberectus]|nr:Abscisic stress-ripening protein 1 [Spatholobus suberectus]